VNNRSGKVAGCCEIEVDLGRYRAHVWVAYRQHSGNQATTG